MIAEAVAAVTLTRGPVAESVTRRTAIISFRTSARDHDSVLLRNGARIDAGTGVVHVARLTRLRPGKRYEYTVEGEAGALATGAFRAAPAGASRFTFAVVGDFGSGTSDETAVASLIESWHPDFVLTVGDNAYPSGSKDGLAPSTMGASAPAPQPGPRPPHSCRSCSGTASRSSSSAISTPTPAAARDTGSCTWRSGRAGHHWTTTPASSRSR